MSELEEMKRQLANPNLAPEWAKILRFRIAAIEAVVNGPRYLMPPAQKP